MKVVPGVRTVSKNVGIRPVTESNTVDHLPASGIAVGSGNDIDVSAYFPVVSVK